MLVLPTLVKTAKNPRAINEVFHSLLLPCEHMVFVG